MISESPSDIVGIRTLGNHRLFQDPEPAGYMAWGVYVGAETMNCHPSVLRRSHVIPAVARLLAVRTRLRCPKGQGHADQHSATRERRIAPSLFRLG